MSLYCIEHIPTKRFYTPNNGSFRPGRNWRKNKAVLYTDLNDAENERNILLEKHRSGEQLLKIRSYGGYDSATPEDSVGDGYIRERDFRVTKI
jgi:hypothetical protein